MSDTLEISSSKVKIDYRSVIRIGANLSFGLHNGYSFLRCNGRPCVFVEFDYLVGHDDNGTVPLTVTEDVTGKEVQELQVGVVNFRNGEVESFTTDRAHAMSYLECMFNGLPGTNVVLDKNDRLYYATGGMLIWPAKARRVTEYAKRIPKLERITTESGPRKTLNNIKRAISATMKKLKSV